MTRKEIRDMISRAGVPSAYYQFSQATAKPPPFICFYYLQNDDFKADNTNYVHVEELIIELYTDNKDFELEDSLETILNDAGLVYSKTEAFIDSEKMYMETYTMEVIINV